VVGLRREERARKGGAVPPPKGPTSWLDQANANDSW